MKFEFIVRLTLCDCLYKASQDKGKIISWVEAMPESAGNESRHTGSKSRLLPPRRDTEIHIVSQPIVGIDIPVSQVCASVLSGLDAPGAYISKSVPGHFASDWINAFVAQSR